jgi:hypothetical protein
MKLMLKPPKTKRLKLRHDWTALKVCFQFHLHHYTSERFVSLLAAADDLSRRPPLKPAAVALSPVQVGTNGSTMSSPRHRHATATS